MNKLSIEELKQWVKENRENGKRADAIRELIALRELKGEQVPVGIWRIQEVTGEEGEIYRTEFLSVSEGVSIPKDAKLFSAPQKPVVPVPVGFLFVVKATGQIIYSTAATDVDGAQLVGPIYGDLEIEAAGGIVKDGE